MVYRLGLWLALVAGCGSGVSPGDDSGGPPADLAMGPDSGAMSGDCTPKCSGLTPKCNARKHCVGCLSDKDCGTGSYCKITSDALALCTPGCNDDGNCAMGQKCCKNRCVDPNTDVSNCGGCDMPCTAMHAGATCKAGQCSSGACDPGWGDCN